MSQVGYYRYKFTPTSAGEQDIKIYINGALVATHTVIVRDFCTNYKILKYLDRSGRYRFFAFNDKWQLKNTPTTKGTIENFVTSIVDNQSSDKQIGYTNKRIISLTAGNVSSDELEKLFEIYSSPRVYLYTGSGLSDKIEDWIQVTVTGDGINRRRKEKFAKVNIDVTLPETFEISMI
jgi:hypothetical protein